MGRQRESEEGSSGERRVMGGKGIEGKGDEGKKKNGRGKRTNWEIEGE